MNKRKTLLLVILFAATGLCAVAPEVHAEGHGVHAVLQQEVCKGVVVDSNGEPIIGASVKVKGSQNGTLTDISGNFVLHNVPAGAVIQVSYIGYKTQEKAFEGDKALNFTLMEDNKQLNEVVVVGYATQKKVNVTGAVSMVDSKVLESRPVQNVAQALQGQIPGLNMSVGNGGGGLGSQMGITIRGNGTIGTGSNGSPLVLIDGIEGNMNTINPNDIATISVLKDAASTSIYGARAAFGVILITTKNGQSGKTRFSYTGNARFNTAIQIPKMMKSIDFANYFNEAQINNTGSPLFQPEVLEKMKKYLAGEYKDPNTPEYYGTEVDERHWYRAYLGSFANTDWFKEFYRSNVGSQEHNLNISGGNEKITFMVSGSFLDQNGLLRHGKDKFYRYTFNNKLAVTLTDWLKMNVSNKWTRENYSRPSYLTGLFFHNIARRWPTCPVKTPGGHNMHWMELDELEQAGVNRNEHNWLTNQVQFIFEPIKDWHINVDASLRQYYAKGHQETLPIYSYNADQEPIPSKVGGNPPGYSWIGESTDQEDYYAFNLYTDYSKNIGDHYFKVLAGMNTELFKSSWLNGSGDNLVSPKMPELAGVQEHFKTTNDRSELAIAGFFGRLNYDYKERYLFEANIRYDGSSRFVGDKRWGLFPSFSLGWNIAREDFWKPYEQTVGNLKLRMSWGQLGNNEMDARYPFYLTMPFGKENSSWIIDGKRYNTAGMPGIVSSLLTWERVQSWNVGIDFGLFKNRLTGSFDIFTRNTYDMVGPAPTMPAILGTGVPRINNADLKSYGWELELAWRDQIKDFTYGVKFNLSDARQKLLRFNNETMSLNTYYKGLVLGDIWGYTTKGIAQTDQEMNDWLKNNNPSWGSKWAAGDIMYKDLNDDGVVNNGANTVKDHGDLTIIGNSTPRYNFGLHLDAAWKGIDFELFLQGVMKRDYMLTGPYFWGASGDEWQSAGFEEHKNYWTKDRPNAYYPRPIFLDNKNQQTQTRYLQNAAYMRLKNIQLGYTLPQELTNKVGLTKLRFYVSAENLCTLTKLSPIFDPETLGGEWGPGKLYPLQKSISVGLNVNF